MLETERLVLCAIEMSDCARVAELAGDKRIFNMTLLIPHPYALQDAETWIATHAAHWARWREDWTMNFAIRSRSESVLMGVIGLVGVPRHKRAEMGYWLGVPFWGSGVMTEAVRVVAAFAHGELGVHRLEAGVFDGNEGSMNVLRKVGFVEEGVLRARFRKNGKFVDERMFANLAKSSRA